MAREVDGLASPEAKPSDLAFEEVAARLADAKVAARAQGRGARDAGARAHHAKVDRQRLGLGVGIKRGGHVMPFAVGHAASSSVAAERIAGAAPLSADAAEPRQPQRVVAQTVGREVAPADDAARGVARRVRLDPRVNGVRVGALRQRDLRALGGKKARAAIQGVDVELLKVGVHLREGWRRRRRRRWRRWRR
jgi:hypothetical protein